IAQQDVAPRFPVILRESVPEARVIADRRVSERLLERRVTTRVRPLDRGEVRRGVRERVLREDGLDLRVANAADAAPELERVRSGVVTERLVHLGRHLRVLEA